MYELHLNKDGETQQWWINFLIENRIGASIINLEDAFKEWKAELVIENHIGDKILFKNEADMVWFLLNYS